MNVKNLKFRAYDKELQCETKFKIYYSQVLFFDKNSNFWKYDDTEKRFSITQFTGYHDKDGKEIYLGDVVEADNDGKKEYGEVKFGIFHYSDCSEYLCSRRGFYVDVSYYFDGENIGRMPLEYADGIVKVIGNVAENKIFFHPGKYLLDILRKKKNCLQSLLITQEFHQK